MPGLLFPTVVPCQQLKLSWNLLHNCFCYREKVIHFLAIELHLYIQHYDLVFLEFTVLSTCLSWYTRPQFLGMKNQKVCSRSVAVEFCLKSLFVVLPPSRLLGCFFDIAETEIPASAADDSVWNVLLRLVLDETLIFNLWTRPYLKVCLTWFWWCTLSKNALTAVVMLRRETRVVKWFLNKKKIYFRN